MKTIKGLIAAGLAETEAARRIRRDESMRRVYAEYPDLRDIDSKIIDIRKDRLIAMIDHDERLAKRYDIEENNLIAKREQIISENNIDPEFDEEQSICPKCGDTGFVKGKDGTPKVCSCKQAELEECYMSCGLGDYSSFTMKNSNGYLHSLSSKDHRQASTRSPSLWAMATTEATGLSLFFRL